VLGLVLVVVVVGVTLTVVLWAGTLFLQSYLYTEATTDIFWQAPAAGLVLTLFFGLWCLLDANAEVTNLHSLPYDTFLRFSPIETKGKKPVEHLWAVKKNEKEPLKYRRVPDLDSPILGNYRYVREFGGRPDPKYPWSPTGVIAILIEEDGQKVRYDLVKGKDGANDQFVAESGWVVKQFGSPTGQPEMFRTGRFLVNVLLNLLHFGLWFACLWLLLRFQWTHALGLAAVLWVVMTLTVLPMMLMQAGAVAQESATPQRTAAVQNPDLGSTMMGTTTMTNRLSSSRMYCTTSGGIVPRRSWAGRSFRS
jgi:hypothetical protein